MKTTTILERDYWEMLEVLPPRKMATGKNGVQGFLVGEVSDHADGARYSSHFKCDKQYFEGPLMNVEQFMQAIDLDQSEFIDNAETPDNVQKELDLYESHSEEAVNAYHKLGIESDKGLEDFEEAYSGEFDSDEDFARDMAEQTDAIKEDMAWPYSCIDWEHASRELMYDYSEQDGHYFRNI